jgi:hypothetical protein
MRFTQALREGYITVSSFTTGARASRRRTRAVITTAAALTTAAVLAAPAGAAVNGTHTVAVLTGASALELSGYPLNATLNIQAQRGTTVIGTATGVTTPDRKAPNTGDLNVNPDACWIGSTPDILPGDTITVDDGVDPVDSMTVENVGATSVGRAANGDVLLHGFAIAPGGGQFDKATFDASVQGRITIAAGQLFSNGKNTIRAGATKLDGTVAYDSPTATTWTADFPLNATDAALALNAKDFEGVFTVGVSELTIGRTPVGALGAGCPPIARNAVTTVDAPHTVNGGPVVNAANVGTPMTLSGAAQPDATAVAVTLTDANGTSVPVTVPAPANGLWKADPVDVSGLADGALTASVSVTIPNPAGGTSTITGAPMTIAKDTVAPPAPVTATSPGIYPTAQDVTLEEADPAASIHFTTGLLDPTANSPRAAAPIHVANTTTIKAIAVDPAGNASPVTALAYTIQPPASQPPASQPPASRPPASQPAGGGGGTGTIIRQVPGVGPTTQPATGRALRATGLVAQRISAARLRARGLPVTMRLPKGTKVVRIAVFRVRHGRRAERIASVIVPAHAGTFRTTLRSRALRALRPGSYELDATPGRSRSDLRATSRAALTVGR